MTSLIELNVQLAATNVLLERGVVALEAIALALRPPPPAEPTRQATIDSLHRIDNVALRRAEDEMRRAMGLTEEEWEYGGRR